MRITSTKKVVVEDFPSESRDDVQRLAQILNPFLDQVAATLGNQVTLTDNLKARVYTRSLIAGTSAVQLNWELNEKPTEVRLAQLTRPDATVPTAVFCIHWTYANKVISCTLLGLDATKQHNVTIVGQV